MKFKINFIVLILLMGTSTAFAQKYKIGGEIKDQNKKEISFASIVVYNAADTSMLTYGMSSEKGKYVIDGVKPGNYLLYAARVGNTEIYIPFTIKEKNIVQHITLETDANILRSFKVYSKKTPILYHGDTLVYNPKFFKTKTNATVEDLLKKLPGMRVDKNGNIVSEGQEVIKVLINGKEFFGNDVKMATKNLDADAIKKIEVIDRKTDEDTETGEDTKTTEKVINLVLKKEYTKGYFGTVSAGYGTDDKYTAQGNMNFFAPKAQLTIIGGLNNIDDEVFGWSAIRSLNANEINPNYDWFSYSNSGVGITTEKGIGSNFNYSPKKGTEINVSYLKSNTINNGNTSIKSENYLAERTVLSEDNSINTNKKNKDIISTVMRFKIDSLTRLNVQGQLNISNSDNNSASLKEQFLNPHFIINSGVRQSEQKSKTLGYSGKIRFTRQGKKKKKRQNNYFNSSVYYKDGNSSGEKYNYYNTKDSVLLPFPNSSIWLLNDNLTAKEKTISFNNKYKIGLTKKAGLAFGLNLQNIKKDYIYEWIPTGTSKVIPNSPIGLVNTQIITPFVNFSYAIGKFTRIYTTLKYQHYNENRDLKTDVNNKFLFNKGYWLPSVYFNANKPRNYRFHMSLGSNVNAINISNLLPITDYSNPFYTKKGNIELSNPVRYYYYANYNKTIKTNNSFRLYTWNSFTNNALVQNSSIDSNNFRISQMVNFRNSINTYSEVEYFYFIKKLKMHAGLKLNYSRNRAYFIQNNNAILNRNNSFELSPFIAFNKFDKWNLDLSYKIKRRYGKIGENVGTYYWNNGIDLELVYNPVDWFEFTTELDWYIIPSVNNYTSNSTPLWNAEVSFFMGKKKRWTLGASVFDILNSNQSINRYWDQNAFVEYRKNVLTRFAMLNVKYKIKKPKGKSKKKKRHH